MLAGEEGCSVVVVDKKRDEPGAVKGTFVKRTPHSVSMAWCCVANGHRGAQHQSMLNHVDSSAVRSSCHSIDSYSLFYSLLLPTCCYIQPTLFVYSNQFTMKLSIATVCALIVALVAVGTVVEAAPTAHSSAPLAKRAP